MKNEVASADFAVMPRPNHWVTQTALDYWMSIRGANSIPARADMDPMDIPRLLPNLVLLDVLDSPRDFRYRLIGTMVEAYMTTTFIGKCLSEVPYQRAPNQVWSNCIQVVESRQPLCNRVPYMGPEESFDWAEDVILPLAPRGAPVNMLLVAVAYIAKQDY